MTARAYSRYEVVHCDERPESAYAEVVDGQVARMVCFVIKVPAWKEFRIHPLRNLNSRDRRYVEKHGPNSLRAGDFPPSRFSSRKITREGTGYYTLMIGYFVGDDLDKRELEIFADLPDDLVSRLSNFPPVPAGPQNRREDID